jgi:signal transduction histidine kinase
MSAPVAPGTVTIMRSRQPGSDRRCRSSLVADVCLAGALLAAAELEVLLDGLGPESAALAAVATVPLAWRRRMPVAAFGCVAVLAPSLDRALGTPWSSQANALVFLVLVASYSLAAHAGLRRSLPAVLTAAAWLAAVEALSGDGEDYAFLLLLFGVPWLSGRGVRRYRREAERLSALAVHLREERAVGERVAVARERQRMVHETDDAIAHAVGVMALQASGAEQVLEREPMRARQALVAVQDTGREAVRELREVLGVLHCAGVGAAPPGVDEPTAHAASAATSRRRARTPLVDDVLALILLALGVGYVVTEAGFAGLRAPAVLVQVAAAAAVALRRRTPFPALALSLAAYAGEALLVSGNPGSPATIAGVLLTSYAVAVQGTRRDAAVAAPLALGVPVIVALVVARGDAADVLLVLAVIAIPWLAGRAVAAYRRQGETLAALTAQLIRERDARARLAVLEERARVARELHDTVAHAVSVMVLQAGAAEQVLDCEPDRAREAIRAVQAVAREALDQLGTLLGLLDPGHGQAPLGPRPGLAELERLLTSVRQAGLPVQLRIVGDPGPLPAAVDGAAYRVIQEALTNALKHSDAAPTTVTVRYAAEGVHLDIVDEGRSRVSLPASGGYGLTGMRERVTRHGGRLQAGSAAGGSGFAVSAFLPLSPARDQRPQQVHA